MSKQINQLLLFLLFSLSCSSQDVTSPPVLVPDYSLGRVGSATDVETTTIPGLVLMGGSTDVDNALAWMVEKSGGGDFVVIRVTGGNGYNTYIQGLGELNSVETLRIDSKEAANDPKVAAIIKNAEALFIAGGDQSKYIAFWSGSKVQEAIQYLINEKKVPVGGTSAGCAIMGDFVFTGERGSALSEEALVNPFDEKVTVINSALIDYPLLENTITDQHFAERDREGRLVVFLAHMAREAEAAVKAIAVDEKTAVCIEADGSSQVFGLGNAYYLLESDAQNAIEKFEPGESLHWYHDGKALIVSIIAGGVLGSKGVNVRSWEIGTGEFWSVSESKLLRVER